MKEATLKKIGHGIAYTIVAGLVLFAVAFLLAGAGAVKAALS